MKVVTKHKYTVYGLYIESEIEIKEFVQVDKRQACEVQIRYGEMCPAIHEQIQEGRQSSFSPNETWFYIKDVAVYQIKEGDTIRVEPCEKCDEQLMRVYLMCSCLGFIMIQRHKVAIHGGVVATNGQEVVITGDRGAGKSTLATELRQRGYCFLADDVAATVWADGPKIQPGFPYQKLCGDAMDQLGYDKKTVDSFKSDTQVKYMVPVKDTFVKKALPLKAICEVVPCDVQQVEILHITGQQKLMYLIKNIYRGEFMQALGGMQADYFKACIAIAKEIDFYVIKRPKDAFTIEAQVASLEEMLA